jgi:hypothetical protein
MRGQGLGCDIGGLAGVLAVRQLAARGVLSSTFVGTFSDGAIALTDLRADRAADLARVCIRGSRGYRKLTHERLVDDLGVVVRAARAAVAKTAGDLALRTHPRQQRR